MLNGRLKLHDITDAEAFCKALIPDEWKARLQPHDLEDLASYLIETCWELSIRNPQPWHTSFSGWVTPRLQQRRYDWLRKHHGRTKWTFHDRTYERELPHIGELTDECQPPHMDPAEHHDPDSERLDTHGSIGAAAYLPPRNISPPRRVPRTPHPKADSHRRENQAA